MGENITRESLRNLGIENEETISGILAMRSAEISKSNEAEQQMKKDLEEAQKKAESVDILNNRIKELETQTMTAEELQAQKIKDAELARRKYETLSNKIEAQKVLMQAGMYAGDGMERILDRISTEDLKTTIESATIIADMVKATKESTEKAVREEMIKNNPKPDASNLGGPDEGMTPEKFNSLSYEEMVQYAEKDPDGFAKM